MEAELQRNAETGLATPQAPTRKNFLQLAKDWPMPRKIATGAVLLICIALFAVLIIQARVADQQLLYANLTESDAASVVNWLKAQRIPYSLKNNGKNIWVPADKLYETRLDLAANGLPSGGSVGFEVFDNQSFALTDYVQKVNYTRALQGELARTISSLEPVESTRVHLAIPEKRLFKDQQKLTTASVIVTLAPHRTLSGEQVKGIVHMVAGSIPGLEPENVKVIDSRGMVLESDELTDKDKMLSVDMLAFQQEVEHRMEMRAQDLLDKTMGTDKAMVRVTATIDFSKVEKTEELFDPEEPVIRSEQIAQEASGTTSQGGIPGVESNLQGNTQVSSTTSPSSSSNTRTTNYEISKTVSKIVNPVGTVTQVSVSVLVADKEEKDADGKILQTTRTPEELTSIQNMISAALGLSPQRGDQINVISMPFIETPPGAGDQDQSPLIAESIYQYLPIIKIGLVSLGALLLYFLLIRPVIKTMKGEVTQHYKTVEELERDQAARLAAEEQERMEPPPSIDDDIVRIRREVMQNQVPASYIVKNWIQEG
ncbi:flagellar basal-body MS-ring/collar protein FliF [Desulfopila aestuarii]|uniref:Flagellar M-ring protein n=1 Tax=Desulfopila aestuarii DSM 18488 TaxID=1121416 RepID=A0A1M7YDP3_9BACT|nr:flagellar basal-body MS-ring/collar protein FliF [Desulfopila aestuarii]SHO50706.1 flagellar M-ring protein FliF [Desulfopila aestuarii DSM 18488]